LKKIDHPNVVRLYEIFETPEKLYLVMELCEGGEVFDRYLSNNGKADESTAKRIFRDVVNAIVYCHNHKICHRDLKPENLLLLSKTEPSSVKVIDFGLSAIFDHK
jgi:calcium-dependent protein kinase